MQRQEINLFPYLQAPKAVRSFLSWRMLWIYNLLFLVVFFIIYFFSLWELRQLRNQTAHMQNQIPLLEKKFFDIKNRYPQFFFSQDANKSIEQMQRDLSSQEKILTSLANRQPFSQAFLAFSRNIVMNVWLTGFIISDSGNQITLSGKSVGIDNLQKFLNNLSKEKQFLDFFLNVKDIQNPSKDNMNGILNFELNLAKKES